MKSQANRRYSTGIQTSAFRKCWREWRRVRVSDGGASTANGTRPRPQPGLHSTFDPAALDRRPPAAWQSLPVLPPSPLCLCRSPRSPPGPLSLLHARRSCTASTCRTAAGPWARPASCATARAHTLEFPGKDPLRWYFCGIPGVWRAAPSGRSPRSPRQCSARESPRGTRPGTRRESEIRPEPEGLGYGQFARVQSGGNGPSPWEIRAFKGHFEATVLGFETLDLKLCELQLREVTVGRPCGCPEAGRAARRPTPGPRRISTRRPRAGRGLAGGEGPRGFEGMRMATHPGRGRPGAPPVPSARAPTPPSVGQRSTRSSRVPDAPPGVIVYTDGMHLARVNQVSKAHLCRFLLLRSYAAILKRHRAYWHIIDMRA